VSVGRDQRQIGGSRTKTPASPITQRGSDYGRGVLLDQRFCAPGGRLGQSAACRQINQICANRQTPITKGAAGQNGGMRVAASGWPPGVAELAQVRGCTSCDCH
jgi:hypothetical protein